MKLYHQKTLIGTISKPIHDGSALAMVGDIELTDAAKAYQEVLAFFLDHDKRRHQEPPFSMDLTENWFIEDEEAIARRWMCL